MKAAQRLAYIFDELKNSASAAYFVFRCIIVYPYRYPQQVPEIRALVNEIDEHSHYRLRHPDPRILDTWDVKDPSLQVRGIWTKLVQKYGPRPLRMNYSCTWMWRSRIYIAFGAVEDSRRDIGGAWYSILSADRQSCNSSFCRCFEFKSTREWRRLPQIPHSLLQAQSSVRKVIIFENQAYFFSGTDVLIRFNLLTETWHSVQTHCDFNFPHATNRLIEFYVHLYKGKICVFGGSDDEKIFKHRIFMLLNLRTLQWEKLNEGETNDNGIPILRSGAISWVSSGEDKFFLMYGSPSFHRISNLQPRDRMREEKYSDLWSYSFRQRRWTRERLRGNFPCHRNDAICAYNAKLNKFVLYGGASNDIPSFSLYVRGGTIDVAYCVLGDTFVLDLETRKWRQVITRNFPSWRSAGSLMVDEDGSMYMYGGMLHIQIDL